MNEQNAPRRLDPWEPGYYEQSIARHVARCLGPGATECEHFDADGRVLRRVSDCAVHFICEPDDDEPTA